MRYKGNTIWCYSALIALIFFPTTIEADAARTFEYDKNNQLVSVAKANGSSVSYEYDSCGRITKELASDSAAVEFAYDKNGNCTKMTDAHGTTSYSYDLFNRMTAVQFPDSKQMYYRYDLRGRLVEITYPSTEKVSYVYDAASRLKAVKDSTGITAYDYDDATNTLTRVRASNGMQTEYLYDKAQRITDVIHTRSDGTKLASYHYTFDASGNKTQVISGAGKTMYSYDKLNRIVLVEYPEGYEKFTYDALGNRLTKETPDGVVSYEYDLSNRLICAGDTEFFYDKVGNLIKKVSGDQSVEFVYDAHDNLIEFRDGKHTVCYSYDGAKRRISKTVDGVVTKYVNDVRLPLTQVMLKTSSSGDVIAAYTYGLSRLSEITPDGAHFYLYDYPDRNVIGLVNKNQEVINKFQYGSFGCCQKNLIQTTNDFLYAGEAYDEESGLIYLRNRYYDPELGRFLSPDPEFGSLSNPQSLNPYTYVNNNPLNYIDPSGLRSAKACAYPPGTMTDNERSKVGHGFWELTYDNGGVVMIGRYPGGPLDTDKIYPGTATYEWPATDDQIEEIITSVKKGPYLFIAGNCINGLERGLDVLGVKHPSFRAYGASTPAKAMIWLESLNGKSEFYDRKQREFAGVIEEDDFVALYGNRPEIPKVARAAGDVGGVSLNKTAKLLGHISEVEGATYDANTGQLIMVGKKNVALPEMDFDDLAVAVRSIYGLGGKKPATPGVSLDFDPAHLPDMQKIANEGKKPHPFIVRFEGQTKDTRFGEIMYEADRLLKCISLGKDNNSGKKVEPKVDGFKNLINRYRKTPLDDTQHHSTRMWFVPKEMSLHKNRKGNAIQFKKATMKVMTETKLKNKIKGNNEAEKFAEHFTKHYDDFAKKYPVLKELKRLAKITAVVKWMRDNKIPLDLSLFEQYKPAHKSTPKTTPAMLIVNKDIDEDRIRTLSVVGGVIYHLDDSNFHEAIADDVDPLSAAAMRARPSENVFKWTFKSPSDSQEYQAVAQTLERTVKVGNVRKACVDMQFPSLQLVRYYNSFNDSDIGFGRGWDLVSAHLRFPRAEVQVVWSHEKAAVSVYPEIFAEVYGRELCFTLQGLNDKREPVYFTGENQILLIKTAAGYSLQGTNQKKIDFTEAGKVVKDGKTEYAYDEQNRLQRIQNDKGDSIVLTYNKGRITKICGPGQKCVTYEHDANGQLNKVSDALGVIERYAYDKENNLTSVHNAKGEEMYTAGYDEYHRAVCETQLGIKQNNQFNLSAHTMQQNDLKCTYDATYRLLEAEDVHNRRVQLTYQPGSTRPDSLTDCLGNTKTYTYDMRGNIIKITDSQGAEERFWYNQNNSLMASRDPMGRVEVYQYDALNRLIKIFHAASIQAEDKARNLASFAYNPLITTEYAYGAESGRIESIHVCGEQVVRTGYGSYGLPILTENATGYRLFSKYDDRGRLISVYDGQNRGITYAYDDRDRVTKVANFESSIEYTYDQAGNLSSVLDSKGNKTSYTFDVKGNLHTIEDALGNITRYEYDEKNKLKAALLPNGTIRAITYDDLNRPTGDELV